MAVGLVVIEPFGEYACGTVILGAERVAAVLASPNAGSVTRFTTSDAIDTPPEVRAPTAEPEPSATAPDTAPEHPAETSEKGA